MLNFRQIQTFRAVMLSGSMTQAAKELHTSQPNVSRVIGELERRIGLKLFERHSGKLIPTLEGQAFFQDVEHTFAAIRSLEDAALGIRRSGAGRLRVVSVPSMAMALVPEAIHVFAQKYPTVNVTLHATDSLTVCQWVASGYADVGITSEIFNATGVDSELLQSNVGVLITPRGHRLARHKRAMTPQDLAGETFISLKSSDRARRHIDEVCLIDGKERRILAYESHFAAAICHMVACAMGISIANPLVTRAYAKRVATLAFVPKIEFPTYLIYPLNSPVNMLAKSFATGLRSCCT